MSISKNRLRSSFPSIVRHIIRNSGEREAQRKVEADANYHKCAQLTDGLIR
jgi:hypothetical protein